MSREDHSRFGGSIADRYLNCPGSVALCASVPELPPSPYAAEGTLAHTLAEYCLRNGYANAAQAAEETSYAHKDGSPIVFPPDMTAAVQVYLDAVYEEIAAAKDSELYVEAKFTFPGMNGEVYGRNDALVYTPSRRRLVVFDYKHGVGISVGAENNVQLKFYATGGVLSNDWSPTDIELVIVQPRARDVDEVGAVKRWRMDVLEILNFAGELEAGVQAAKDPLAELKTGSWCRWCDAAAVCPAREKEALAALGVSLVDVTVDDLPEPSRLDGDRISQVLKGLTILSGWAAQVQEFAESHMIAGNLDVPGWKVVDKIGRAKWIDSDAEVAGYLDLTLGMAENDIFIRKLETITEIKKRMKMAGATKEAIDTFLLKYTVKESSGLTIAPVSDRREAVDQAARQFEGVILDE